MTSINEKKKEEKENNMLKEKLYFHLDEDIIETEDDINRLEEILDNTEIDDKTKSAFKSANNFYKKLMKNNYVIS